MKKLVAILISLSLPFSFVACGNGSTSSEADTTAADASSTVTSESEDVETSMTEGEEVKEVEEEIPFEEITVIDNEQCLIKITGIEPDNMWGYTLKAYMENKSADKTIAFSVYSAAVNGVQTDPFFATEVAAGKKSNEEISFSDENLSNNGIDEFTDIELTFRVYDSDDWSTDDIAKETVHVYPLGEEQATVFQRESQPTDNVVADNDSITVIVTGYSEDEIWGYTVNLYLVNKTDMELMYSVSEASINGFMADPFWASSVGAGKVAFTTISWADSTFEENGITSVDEIEMKLRVYNSEDWSADDIFNETITLNP